MGGGGRHEGNQATWGNHDVNHCLPTVSSDKHYHWADHSHIDTGHSSLVAPLPPSSSVRQRNIKTCNVNVNFLSRHFCHYNLAVMSVLVSVTISPSPGLVTPSNTKSFVDKQQDSSQDFITRHFIFYVRSFERRRNCS